MYKWAFISTLIVGLVCVKMALDASIRAYEYEHVAEAYRNELQGLERTIGHVDTAFHCVLKE